MKNWFDGCNTGVGRIHREAYEKSLKCNSAVKVQNGCYYYKGYEVERTGGTDYPWNYRLPSEITSECAKTKKEALEIIDYILKNKEIDLCDIIYE